MQKLKLSGILPSNLSRLICCTVIILVSLAGICYPVLADDTPVQISISASNRSVSEGSIVAFTVIAIDASGKRIPGLKIQPELDAKPWCGPFEANAQGVSRFVLPMPYSGEHSITVQSQGVISRQVDIKVTPRHFNIITDPNHLVGMDYETWFGPGYAQWGHQEATPILGEYSSLDPRVLRQQTLWMDDLGINFVELDWSNNLDGNWPSGTANEMVDSTNLLCRTYLKMKQHPLIVLLVGPDGGKWGTPNFMSEVNYIYHHYIQDPAFRKLFINVTP